MFSCSPSSPKAPVAMAELERLDVELEPGDGGDSHSHGKTIGKTMGKPSEKPWMIFSGSC